MSEPELRVFPDSEALSQEAARQFESLSRECVGERAVFSAALSGGSTPRRLYELLAGPGFSSGIPWHRVRLFQVDERCVPPEHPDSNYRMIREALLDRAPVPSASFHRLAAELPHREATCREYAQEMARVLGSKGREAPGLDLIYLGMGPCGHTASLFPGSAALDERNLWIVPNYVPKLAACRLTMTFPVLNAARRIIFLVAGAEKAETLRQVVQGPRQTELYPAQGVQPRKGRVSWYVDEAAASLLNRRAV